jgi:hypothetical protein
MMVTAVFAETLYTVKQVACLKPGNIEVGVQVIFWVVMSYSVVLGHQHFRGLYCFHLQGDDLILNLPFHENLKFHVRK